MGLPSHTLELVLALPSEVLSVAPALLGVLLIPPPLPDGVRLELSRLAAV